MNVRYTTRATVDTNGLMIRRLGSGAESVPAIDIPKEVAVRAITICPDKASGAFPIYYVKGMHSSSSWAKIEADVGVFTMDGISDNEGFFMYVRADSGTITLNVWVKGDR